MSVPLVCLMFAVCLASRQNSVLAQKYYHQNETTASWPSLQFHFTIQRSTMNIYGHSDFSVFAKPVLNGDRTKVLYDTFSSITQGSTTYNYTLSNGVAVLSTKEKDLTPSTTCLKPEADALPPINKIVSALNQATRISSFSSENRGFQCSPDSLYKVTVNGIDFAVCASKSNGFTMHSSDMNINVEYLWDRDNEFTQGEEIHAGQNCSSVIVPTLVTHIGSSLLSGKQTHSETRKLKAAFDFSWGSSSCACKSKPRPCIFIHGTGIKKELPQNQDSFEDYWGDHLPNHAPCCSSMKFAVLDTEHNEWINDDLQKKVCDRVLAVGNSNTSTISDTIIVTHSMGNLILAGAIANGKCNIDSTTTSWVGISGPMSGSMASDYFQDACADKSSKIMEMYVDIVGMCPINPAIKSLANERGHYCSAALLKAYIAAQEVYRKHVSALMCSGSVSGLLSISQVKFRLLHSLVPYKSDENDGMVEFESCTGGIPASKFGTTWKNPFYKAELNHADTTFRNGDGLFNTAKMPLKWFECLL